MIDLAFRDFCAAINAGASCGACLGHARLASPYATFCAVDRPSDHPRRPKDYVPLDAFWQHCGYVKRPDLVATFEWKEIDEAQESPKTLTFG
jgi:hypothetical protein